MTDRIFISHASEDAAVADRIVAYLEARGAPCWIASRDIPPRAIYADAIVEGMQSCGACAVLVSAASNASKAVKREVELASHEDKAFIPIRVDSSEPASGLAYYLRNSQWVEYKRNGDRALDRIVGPPEPSARQAETPRTPAPTHKADAKPATRVPPALFIALGVAVIFIGGWLLLKTMQDSGRAGETSASEPAANSEVTSTSTAVADRPANGTETASRGVVRVLVILQSEQGRMLYGSGSGFAVAPNLVVTNAHVVAAARQRTEYSVGVVPPVGDGMVRARIIRYSPASNLALLELEGNPNLRTLAISTTEPQVGDSVVALGYPDADYQGARAADLLRPSAASRTSDEILSLRDRAPTGEQLPTINHRAIISSGSSGGPLLDNCGWVVGINSWHVSGPDARDTRGVAMRVSGLIEFLREAGVDADLAADPCTR